MLLIIVVGLNVVAIDRNGLSIVSPFFINFENSGYSFDEDILN